ncbi:MAG: hypothetical protein JO247_02655 [Chloroflexi bacterium]|nr:hypothetical protein [Chloroflexota bacterium]
METRGGAGALRRPLRRLRQTLGEILYGFTGLEFEHQARQLRGELETMFMLMTVGDYIGVPVMPPYYSLRMLPYFVEVMPAWRRRVLRERHPLDSEEFDLHGI